jgi:uncharacterized protein YndB with AHSA1/START domain
MLKAGQTVRVPGDERLWLVKRVTSCSATVQPIGARHVEVRQRDGSVVGFDAPGRAVEWSPNANVEVVG